MACSVSTLHFCRFALKGSFKNRNLALLFFKESREPFYRDDFILLEGVPQGIFSGEGFCACTKMFG